MSCLFHDHSAADREVSLGKSAEIPYQKHRASLARSSNSKIYDKPLQYPGIY